MTERIKGPNTPALDKLTLNDIFLALEDRKDSWKIHRKMAQQHYLERVAVKGSHYSALFQHNDHLDQYTYYPQKNIRYLLRKCPDEGDNWIEVGTKE